MLPEQCAFRKLCLSKGREFLGVPVVLSGSPCSVFPEVPQNVSGSPCSLFRSIHDAYWGVVILKASKLPVQIGTHQISSADGCMRQLPSAIHPFKEAVGSQRLFRSRVLRFSGREMCSVEKGRNLFV